MTKKVELNEEEKTLIKDAINLKKDHVEATVFSGVGHTTKEKLIDRINKYNDINKKMEEK